MAEFCHANRLPVSKFTFTWEAEGCKQCNKPLHVWVSRKRSKIISTTHGMFEAVELQGYCPQHQQLTPEHSHELQTIVAPGDNYAYDTLVQVGLKRFTYYRQAPEISLELLNQFGIVVPESSVNYLARKFVAYFQIVHEESIGLLRSAMQERGGYILHIDGTCDKGSRVLLVCVDSLSGQVMDSQEHVVNSIVNQRSKKKLQSLCSPETIKGSIHALAAWVLAYRRDGQGYKFPFDMPYLRFYERILIAHEALHTMDQAWEIQKKPNKDPFHFLYKLRTILDKVVIGEAAFEFQQIVADAKRDQRIFTQLRTAMKICPKGKKPRSNDEDIPKTLSEKHHKAILKTLRTSLVNCSRKDEKKKRACDIVVTHLDKYWDYLYGHSLKKGTRNTVVPRTNNFLEGLFGVVSRQCRRLHGRGHIGRDLETMPASTPLILNLKNASYCETVYGGNDPEGIVKRFSKVDQKRVSTLMKTWQVESVSSKLPRKLEQLKSLPRQVTHFLLVAAHAL